MEEYFKTRKKILLDGINYFQKCCNEFKNDPDYQYEIKILISNLGVRLYNKMVEDKIIDDNCYTDIDLACREYQRLRELGSNVKMTLITPAIEAGFGEEECIKIWRIYQNLGVPKDYYYCSWFSHKDEPSNPHKDFEAELFNSIDCAFCYFGADDAIFISQRYLWKYDFLGGLGKQLSEYVFDLNCYINEFYIINNNEITINGVLEPLDFTDFIYRIYEEFYEIYFSEKYRRDYNLKIMRAGGSLSYDLYAQDIIGKNLTDEEKKIMDILAQYGFFNAENGKYYINGMTKLLVPSVFSKYPKLVASMFSGAIRMYCREPDAIQRIFSLCDMWFELEKLEERENDKFKAEFGKLRQFLEEHENRHGIQWFYRTWESCFSQVINTKDFIDSLLKEQNLVLKRNIK